MRCREWISLCNTAEFLNKQRNVDIVFAFATPTKKEDGGILVAKRGKKRILVLPNMENPEVIAVKGYPFRGNFDYMLGSKQKWVYQDFWPDTLYGIKAINRVLNKAVEPKGK